MKHLAILGSTGSIGTQTLEVVDQNPDQFKVVALTARNSIETLIPQIEKYKPEFVCVSEEEAAKKLQNICSHIKVLNGENGLLETCSIDKIDIAVNGLVGIAGLKPTLKLLENGKLVALANKESLVTGGHLIQENIVKFGGDILPLDSEHSAIFQCIQNCEHKEIEKIIITCSGGPFRSKSREEMQFVSQSDALNHPNWSMGSKITIDSATLMNKGLEVIEAVQLFDLSLNQVDVVIHPQSSIHSFVQFQDGNILAQIGPPDMRMAISYALHYPQRAKNTFQRLNLIDQNWNFSAPDTERFPCLKMAYDAIAKGGSYPVVLNTANEVAVELFLSGKIPFLEIETIIRKALDEHESIDQPTLDDIFLIDETIRNTYSVICQS